MAVTARSALARVRHWLFAAPVLLYGVGHGRLLGHRFLLLEHRGRRSGQVRRCVLEVLEWSADRDEFIVVAGFGRRSGWYQNVVSGGALEIQIAGRRFSPDVRVLAWDEATEVLARYEQRNRWLEPIVHRLLARLTGIPYDGSPTARERTVQKLPLVAFRCDPA